MSSEIIELSERAFMFFDENGNVKADFLEFVVGCWSCCVVAKPLIGEYGGPH